MKDNTELLYSIALMYYQEGLTQEEISKKTGLSRPNVSRALAKAMKLGIVEIKLHAPRTFENEGIELEKALKLEKVYIAPSGALTEFAAGVLDKELSSSENIGVGWGKTVYRTVQKMVQLNLPKHEKNSIVPLVSSLGIKEPQYQVNLMISLMTDAIGGTPYFYNPSDLHLKDVKEIWGKLDAAVMGLGSGKYHMTSEMEKDSIKGEILGKFFSDNGILSYEWPGYDGISWEHLQKTKKRICLCDGSEKIEAIMTAAKLGLFNVLITDTKTADELCEAVCKKE